MPNRPRANVGGIVFHVCNRAIQGLVLFAEPTDFQAFLRVVTEAAARHGMRILAFIVMPNHWHFVLWPEEDHDLAAFMQWLSMTHAKRWRQAFGTQGRGAVYQGRYRAIPVQRDVHFIRVCHYVERNALRARLVERAEDWPWSSAFPVRSVEGRPVLTEWPVPRPADWLEQLNVPESSASLESVRHAVRKNIPFGTPMWRAATSRRLSWRLTGANPGRSHVEQKAPRSYRVLY